MAITQIRGAQVLDATITEDDLNASVAGVGISGGAGAPLAVDLDEVDAAAVVVADDSIAILDSSAAGDTKKESIADLMTAVAGAGLTATSGVLDVLVDTAELAADAVTGAKIEDDAVDSEHIASGAVDVDHLSDLRVTEGTGLVADFTAGTVSTDDGSTVTVVSVNAGTTTVADDDVSFVEVDSAGSVTNNTTGFTQGRLPLAEVTAAAADITVVVDKRAWLDIDLGASGLVEANFVDNEVPTGDLDGADTTYVLADEPSPAGSLRVYLNGIRQDEGAGDDYTLATATITFAAAPVSTDKILCDYRKA